MILKMLTPIWKTKTVTAKRVRNRVAAVLDYAAAAKYRTGTNPARWEGHLEHLLPQPEKIARVTHHAAIPYAVLSQFMVDLRKCEGVIARALEFTVLTAARTGEVVGATWDEIDFDARTWTIPAERMKAGKEHRVPLSDAAIKLLSGLYREQDNSCLFIGTRPGSRVSNGMYRLLRQLRSDATIHGFRSTFSTWAHETTSYPGLVIEQSLAHTVGSAVERAYRRGDLFDKRRKLMDAWAKYCASPSRRVTSGEVVQLRGRR
jgi:integrase